MQFTFEERCHISVFGPIRFISSPCETSGLALDSYSRLDGQGNDFLLAWTSFLIQRPPFPSSLPGLAQPPSSPSEVPLASLFQPTTLEELRIRALLAKQSPWAALLTFHFSRPLGALLTPSPKTSASARKPVFRRCRLLSRGEEGLACLHLHKPSPSSLAVGNQLLPRCQDSALGTEERPLMIGQFSTPLCLGGPADFLPLTVIWHPVPSGVSDACGRHFLGMTLMGTLSFGVFTIPTPCR